MQIEIRKYETRDAMQAAAVWNEVVRGGEAFPQMNKLTERDADEFFSSQSFTGLAVDRDTGEIVGLYILHPNNVGRCGHICNTSYAVKSGLRGRHIGEKLVLHSIAWSRERRSATAFFSSTRSSRRTRTRCTFIKSSALPGSASFPAAFSCRTEHMKI